MQAEFWHERWQANDIGFHENQPNEQLLAHFQRLQLQPGQRIFIPLCGKTCDIDWLLSQGLQVAGAELHEAAVEEMFARLKLTPEVSQQGKFRHYRAQHIDIYVGDIFDLTPALLGPVDAIYDRAALVALPESMRGDYVYQLLTLSKAAPQLLLCYEYDEQQLQGPPFSINRQEVLRHYQAIYQCDNLQRQFLPGGLKAQVDATASAWLLSPQLAK